MKKYLLLFLLIPFLANAQTILTAEDAIEIGLKNNYDIQIARNTAEIARNSAGLGTSGFLPTVDALGNYRLSSSEQETNSPIGFGNSTSENLSGSIALNWTLFDGFQMFANRSRFNELAKLGEYQARYQIENTVVGILAAYFNLVQQEQLLDVARNSRDVSETRLNKAKVRRDLGGTSATDLLNAQVSFNNDVATILNQELQVSISRKNLNILLGREPSIPITVEKEISIRDVEFEIENLMKLAQERNSLLQFTLQGKRVADQNVRLAQSAFYPRLSLNASYGYTDSETDREVADPNSFFPKTVESQNKDAAVGLSLSFNLFNGFRNKIDLQNARIEAMNQELALADAKNQIAGLVQEKYDTFKKQLELVSLEEQNVVAAQQNLDLQLERYNIGTASSLEFRDAQVNLIRAQTTLIAARYQARITRLEIEQLIGKLGID
ncbi:MAG: TolC family protein [bacterium]|nr:TolC family protein [bacterium]